MKEHITSFLRRHIFFVLLIAGLLYTLPVYNKYWAPFDEGIITTAAERLLSGELPYKDFFIVMYPPGQIYVLAALMKTFSSPLIAGRIYTVFTSVGISLLAFYMTQLLTRRFSISLFSWFLVLVSLAPRLGAIPTPIWPGVFLALCGLFMYMFYLEKMKQPYILFTGVLAGLAILFRHDIGIFALLAILGSLFTRFFYDKKALREIVLVLVGASIVILPCIIYFASKSAMPDMAESLILFPFIHEKTAGLHFPKPCFNPVMIFHGSLYFIKANQYYIPILVYVLTAFYLVSMFLKKMLHKKENLMLLAVLLFGIFTFNQVRIRTDPAHLLTVIQPAVVLFGFVIYNTHYKKTKTGFFRYAICALILMLFVLLSVKNVDKYIKNTFRKPYKKDIVKTRFNGESIYIPKDETTDIIDIVNFIKEKTKEHERIYIGNIAHWKDDFGGSTILYTLCQRLPSTKYYEILPGLITQKKVQEEIVISLSKDNVTHIILQDIELPGPNADGHQELDRYIEKNFEPVKKFGKYNIYEKK